MNTSKIIKIAIVIFKHFFKILLSNLIACVIVYSSLEFIYTILRIALHSSYFMFIITGNQYNRNKIIYLLVNLRKHSLIAQLFIGIILYLRKNLLL